jgi:hypothetical protein
VRPGLTGWLEYTRIGRDRIGFDETGSWTIESSGGGTLVHHRFQHTGPLASALRHAYRGVAALRLQRLARAIDPAG